MSSIIEMIGFKAGVSKINAEIPEIYPMSFASTAFVKTDINFLFKKILTDCARRTKGMKEEYEATLWDNCLGNEASMGLISLMAKAISGQTELFIVFNSGVLRIATDQEKKDIETDYKAKGSSSIGVYMNFTNFSIIEILRLYSSLEYCVLKSLNKATNISTATQLKFFDLRKSVASQNAEPIVTQMKSIADALRKGNDVGLDKEDLIEMARVDVGPTEKAMELLNQRRAYYTGLPQSYIHGEQTSGMGSTGEQDARAVDEGLLPYWMSWFKPAVEALFKIKVRYKPSDYRQISTALDTLKTFELIQNDMISMKDKREIIWSQLDLDFEDAMSNIEDEKKQRQIAIKASSSGDQSLGISNEQVNSLISISERVAAGSLPKSAAKLIIASAFNISEVLIDKLIDPI